MQIPVGNQIKITKVARCVLGAVSMSCTVREHQLNMFKMANAILLLLILLLILYYYCIIIISVTKGVGSGRLVKNKLRGFFKCRM